MKNDLEDLKVYQNFVELLSYTYIVVKKYPKNEQNGLVCDIKNTTIEALNNIIFAEKNFKDMDRINFLNNCDSKLKLLKVLVRISYNEKYISSRNYGSWSRKIVNVTNLLFGWIKKCQKQ